MFISIKLIYNQTAMGTGLDPVTFPGMGQLKRKYVSLVVKIAIFS